jgi:uncharacterized protein
VKLTSCLLMAWVMVAGCATRRADHFYALSVEPAQTNSSRTGFARQIGLHVTLPSLVDRSELVLTARDQVSILEHERWASPLLDQFTSTLGQDIEARRTDLVVTNRSLEQGKLPSSKISLEIVRWTAQRGGQVSLETRWRVTDSISGNESVGRDIVSASMASDDYEQVAAALSGCIAQLAEKLVAQVPPP